MRSLIVLPSANAVAPGQTATFDVPALYTYHGISIYYTANGVAATRATMEADITEIRIKLNGQIQRRFSAATLFAINAFYGDVVDNGYLPIYFSEPWRRTTQGEDALAWGMADISTFTIEVDIKSTAVSPTLAAKGMIERVNRPNGIIKKWAQFTVPALVTGEYNYPQLPKGDAYHALHGFTANVTEVQVKIDQTEEFRATRADALHWYARHGLQMQTGVFTVAFDHTNRVSDALSTRIPNPDGKSWRLISDFAVNWFMSAPTSFPLIAETQGLRN